MKDLSTSRETSRNRADAPSKEVSAADNTLALQPPAYGIDFVDSGMLAAAPVQRQGDESEPEDEEDVIGVGPAQKRSADHAAGGDDA